MYAPHVVTVYYAVEDPVTFDQNHFITILETVLLDLSKGANVRSSGLEGADAANLYIPFAVKAVDGVTGKEKQYIDPKEFEKLEDKSNHWTLDVGDNCFFVKGKVVEVGQDFQYINANYDDVYRVTKVDKKDFGSPIMQHWEVGGK